MLQSRITLGLRIDFSYAYDFVLTKLSFYCCKNDRLCYAVFVNFWRCKQGIYLTGKIDVFET